LTTSTLSPKRAAPVELENALEHFSDGQPNTAVNDLQAFINAVNDYSGESIRTSAVGQQRISEANTDIATGASTPECVWCRKGPP
jgi:hypothetical protein